MKLNWGWGIFIFLLLFMAFILNLVYKCTQVNVDLVSANYYEKEIKYQDQIDRERNSLLLDSDLKINKEEGTLVINYPETFDPKQIGGTIHFFKPDNASLDFVLNVSPASGLKQEVSTSRMKHGWWEIKIDWTYQGTDYYKEEKIRI